MYQTVQIFIWSKTGVLHVATLNILCTISVKQHYTKSTDTE